MKNLILIIFCLLFWGCRERTHNRQQEYKTSDSLIDVLKKDTKVIDITFQVPNSKMSLLARKFTNKDSIKMVLNFFGNSIKDSAIFCTLPYWGDLYFYMDTTNIDYYHDMYFSTEENCFIFQDQPFPGHESKKYSMTEQGRSYLNKLQSELNIPDRWQE